MPGHVKKSTGPDPDPTEFLFISAEMRMADQTKPYDAKKSCWVPDPTEGFVEGNIQGTKGDTLVSVQLKNGAVNDYKKDLVVQVNPPKYEKCEDVSNLTFLNDASVLYNLKSRYQAKLIYTYSGLFCIVINPYKRYPIYTNRAVKIYQGKRRNEVPPHLFAICDGAYMDMLQAQQNQSMLITGESGAGKTENTKKVLSYFANVGATTSKKDTGVKKPNLEDQIVETNPPLEAYGNAKTTRNDNSSRFGKFIRTHFAPNGKLSGADIEVYLLEKARVIDQTPVERGYHIFYQMMSDQVDYIKKLCKLTNDIYDYPYQCKGQVVVQSIDDKEDMEFTHKAFDILNFTNTERDDCYKLTASVMHMGNLKFKQKGREEQAEADGTAAGEIMGELYGVDYEKLYTNLCKPKIKVGAEFVTQGRNVDQVNYSVGALAKALFDRVFKWIVAKCNKTLETGQKRATFIGVLDIAGFEIFDFNGFEQICINFCNEKLQQFFNHHMFVLEQEEYKAEGIDWVFVDFGMDLQACIELFEKKLGLLAILEEESMFPKATDKSFEEKLKSNHLGKSPPFIKPKPPKPGQAEGHFAICHYAGIVTYNLSGWLEKNKDPLNDTVVDQLKKSTCELMVTCFADHPGQSAPAEPAGGKKKKGAGGFKTVSSAYREQLNSLMTTLHSTHPHFIRCIVPNTTKTPGKVEPELIMHQLTCNGVLEGIRICQKGFPNRMPYPDFKHRYKILAAEVMATEPDDMKAARMTFEKAGLDPELYRVGKTKVFFRAGVLGRMEECRDERLGKIISWMQGWCRGLIARAEFVRLQEQRVSLSVLQRNLRKYVAMSNWAWFVFWQKLKPTLNMPRIEDEIRKMGERCEAAVGALQAEEGAVADLTGANEAMVAEIADLKANLEASQGSVAKFIEEMAHITAEKNALEAKYAETTVLLANEEDARVAAFNDKKKAEADVVVMKRDYEDYELNVAKIEQEKAVKDHNIRVLNDEISHQDEIINKLTKEKKYLQELNQKAAEELQGVEEKYDHLNKIKGKLEQTLDELEGSVDHEKKLKSEVERAKKKVEGDVKLTQEAYGDMERQYKDLEAAIQKKDKDIGNLANSLEEQQGIVSKSQKGVKEMQAKIEELESEVELERQARAKAEKAKEMVAKELYDLNERLEEAGGATNAQLELSKKRDAEYAKIRREYEEGQIHHENALAALRKKHNDAVAEMTDQIDHLGKMKAKIEKEKDLLKRDAEEAKSAMDALARDKAAAEKANKTVINQTVELQAKYDESFRTLNDFDAQKKKLAVENAEYLRQYEESEANYGQLYQLKQALWSQLEEVKKAVEDEGKERGALLGKYRNLEHDLDGLREQYDEEVEAKADAQRQYNKAYADAMMWRTKYEQEGVMKAEEIEAARLKVNARLEEAELQIEQLNLKNLTLDKEKGAILVNIEAMQLDFERAQVMAANAEKKQKLFDKAIYDYKIKVDSLAADLDVAQKECRQFSTEHFRVKAMYEENLEHLDAVRRENKGLAEEIKDLMEQISEGGRTLAEIEKASKKYEIEKEELQAALEEAETALEQEETKVLRGQLELSQVKQEIDKRIQEKEEEFEATRKGHARAVENMQASLEAEAKSKAEVLRLKKKLEADIGELEIALDAANKVNGDIQKMVKKAQAEYKDMQVKLEDEQKLASEYREQLAASERKANAINGELEEARTLLEQSDRGRRAAESELSDANETFSQYTATYNSLSVSKRKLEGEYATLHSDLDDMLNEAKNSEDKAKKAMVDAARLADELRAEQEASQNQEKLKKGLEYSVKELQAKIEDSEANAYKTGKKAVGKLEARIKELESQFDDETRRHADANKALRKCERKIKELTFQSDEDKKSHERMQDLVDKLQQKVKTYKKQIEEAEEIAALNLAKYRKAQQELGLL